jgi:hypothetical protein
MSNTPITPVGAVGTTPPNQSNLDVLKVMVQEAMETVAQTKVRALKGDQEAIRQLAIDAARAAEMAQPPPPNSDSELNIKA